MVREDDSLEQGRDPEPVSMEGQQTPCRRKEAQPIRRPACLTLLEEKALHMALTLSAVARYDPSCSPLGP